MRRPKLRRLAPWLPATALLAAGIATTLGVSFTTSATAASDSDSVIVTATVPVEIHNGYAPGACGTVAGTLDTVSLNTASDDTSLGTCKVIFGTNNASSGAVLSVSSPNANGDFFCIRATPGNPTSACSGGAVNEFEDGSGADLAEGTVGGKLASSNGCTTANWTANFSSITNAPVNICTQDSVGTDADYTVEFAADPDSGQGPGTYEGRADLTATAT